MGLKQNQIENLEPQSESHSRKALAFERPVHNQDKTSAVVNRTVLGEAESTPRWHCVGKVELIGLANWVLNLQLDFALPIAKIFAADGGLDWVASWFVSTVEGTFIVDPKTLVVGKKYKFTLEQTALDDGGAKFTFYDMQGSLLGSVTGITGSGVFSTISGVGEFIM